MRSQKGKNVVGLGDNVLPFWTVFQGDITRDPCRVKEITCWFDSYTAHYFFCNRSGGGVIVLEEYEHAKARGAKILAEITGYGATSDGYDMVAPSGEGAVRCMKMSMQNLRNSKVDYVNTHGTSTPVGDTKEIEAMKEVFKDKVPPFSSTKSITGHSLGATSVQEAIYCLLMMKNKFIAASANVKDLDEKIKGLPIVTEVKKNIDLNCVMSNSFGFGGTNATLVFESI